MSPQINFYILSDTAIDARSQFVCKLVEKVYQQGNQVYAHLPNHVEAQKLNQLLWTYRDDSFIPHGLYDPNATPKPAIQIGYGVTPEDHRDILLNLSDDVPSFYSQFARVLEIIPADSAGQALGRDRYRFYRDQQSTLTTHKV